MQLFRPMPADYHRFACLRGCIFTVEGLIGVGKSTLGKSLEKYLNSLGLSTKFLAEFVHQDLLAQYISNMEKYAYSFQLIMLVKRLEIYREAERRAQQGQIVIIDRSIVGDYAFAKMQLSQGKMTEDEFQVYYNMLQAEQHTEPTLTLYLRADVDTCLQRTGKRGRRGEDKYDREYFSSLNEVYEELFSKLYHPVVTLDWTENANIDCEQLDVESCRHALETIRNGVLRL